MNKLYELYSAVSSAKGSVKRKADKEDGPVSKASKVRANDGNYVTEKFSGLRIM